jgi:hypothetical protein
VLRSLLITCAVTSVFCADLEKVDFSRDVEPIFKERCQGCHGPRVQSSGLRLDNAEDALKGGNSGAVIRPGNSAQSRLVRLVAGLDDKLTMPPAGPRLTTKEIASLKAWIDQGAIWSGQGAHTASDRPATASFWAFQPLRKPSPPDTRNRAWPRNAIDRFILARLEEQALDPSPEAAKTTLVRRLYLDLIGLPPQPDDVDAFLRDNRPDAYERLVDSLLASPHYGEKWGRFWLDQARYADSDGYRGDRFRPNAWRYREWVIHALNRDMPFDEFTIEQIAGDLLPNATVDQKVATGFQRNTLTNREGGTDPEQFRIEQVIDRTNTLGTVWLGLTVGCAQCHDHKFDPISQRDYYRLFAFFNSADERNIDAPLPGEMGPYLKAKPEYDRKRRELLDKYGVPPLQAEWEQQMLIAAAHPGERLDWDHAFDDLRTDFDDGERVLRTPASARDPRQAKAFTDYFIGNYHRVITVERKASLKWDELAKQLRQLDESFPDVSVAPTLAASSTGRQTHILIRGDYRQPGIVVTPGTPTCLSGSHFDRVSTRLELARWLVSADQPLTPRIIVNRLWQEHFGRGIVRTSENFGIQGDRPSHPELLDWLAAEFVGSGWSMKQMHRLMVTSAAYRQSSGVTAQLASRDPDNALLARQSRPRLTAELIRDSALAAAGLLDTRIGGRSVRPYQPKGASLHSWNESVGQDRYRRGMYIELHRNAPYPLLATFDAPNGYGAACRRNRSTTPLQALNLLNDPVFVEAAQGLAVRVTAVASGFDARLDFAFRVCLGRHPSPREIEWSRGYYEKQKQALRNDPEAARKLWPIDGSPDTGAWVGLASVLLNLDEFMTRE